MIYYMIYMCIPDAYCITEERALRLVCGRALPAGLCAVSTIPVGW